MIRRLTGTLLCRTHLKSVLLCSLFLVASSGRTEEGSFDSDGVKIHYRVEGKGEPVLLIHGFATNVYLQWVHPGIIRSLARDHRVIALDVRGHGQSDKPTDADKYGTEMVEDAVRLLDRLKIEKAHVVGYSLGALITGKMVATHPDRLLSATLGGNGIFLEGAKLPAFIDELADSLEQGKGIGPLLKALSPPGKLNAYASTGKLLSRSLIGNDNKALAASVRSWKKLCVAKEQLKANKVHTLALIGADDPMKEYVDRMKDNMANLEVVVIDNTDHITAYYNPKFTQKLRKFLREQAQKKKTQERERPR